MSRTSPRVLQGMRDYWNDRAHENAPWYVDTSLSFDAPDMERFFETGEVIVVQALDDAPTALPGRALAVEIGSGLGRVCQALADRFDAVVGVDVAPEMIRRARELVSDPRVEFCLGDGASMPGVSDASVDAVVSFTVFQHIPDPTVVAAYLSEAGRVLRAGGMMSFQWNNQPGALAWSLRRRALSFLQRTGLRPEHRARHAPQFLGSRIPLRRMERMLADAGLELRGTAGEGTLYAWAWATKR